MLIFGLFDIMQRKSFNLLNDSDDDDFFMDDDIKSKQTPVSAVAEKVLSTTRKPFSFFHLKSQPNANASSNTPASKLGSLYDESEDIPKLNFDLLDESELPNKTPKANSMPSERLKSTSHVVPESTTSGMDIPMSKPMFDFDDLDFEDFSKEVPSDTHKGNKNKLEDKVERVPKILRMEDYFAPCPIEVSILSYERNKL